MFLEDWATDEERLATVKKVIRHEKGKAKPWALYTKDGKRLLGRHKTKAQAQAQEAAINAADG
jgi:hypothetical protein